MLTMRCAFPGRKLVTGCSASVNSSRQAAGGGQIWITRYGMTHSPETIASLAELKGRYAAIFCDVWGVVHNGEVAFSKAAHALSEARANGVAVESEPI